MMTKAWKFNIQMSSKFKKIKPWTITSILILPDAEIIYTYKLKNTLIPIQNNIIKI